MNFLAILLAALACFVIGFLWHGPVLGKVWMKLANIKPTGKEKFSDMVPQMLLNFLADLVTAFVLAGILWAAFQSPAMGERTALRGLICGIWVWLGFIVTSSSIDVIWMGKSWKLWLYECACSLTCFVAMGAILGGM